MKKKSASSVSYIDDFLVGGCRALGERERAKVGGCSFSFSVSFLNFGHWFLWGVCTWCCIVLIPLMCYDNLSGNVWEVVMLWGYFVLLFITYDFFMLGEVVSIGQSVFCYCLIVYVCLLREVVILELLRILVFITY